MGFSAELELAKDAALKAGDLIMQYFNKPIEVIEKSPNNPVTEADYKSDELIKSLLKEARPNYGWLSEETIDDNSRKKSDLVWMVDPIDGTRAFIKGLPHFSISIALVKNGQAILGVVYNPATNEMFYAQDQIGAFKNQNQIFASETKSLESAKMLGDRHMFQSKKWPIKWPDFKVEQRNSIAYRIALVASGEFDGAIATTPKNDWDIAAGAIIAKEANAKFADHLGNDFLFNQETPLQRSLVVSNSNIFNDILGHLSHIV